ncbi:MAG TPA: PLP-dependent aminotransferase family protein [Aliidongia sp.]|uniref:aminotransferase-like domain-containing protein n=1 Tax=Aliidongia sp. TaxID=1914230 RepID=UPI002DDDA610|nr:PLP-dependent aminotransferase family protein [Aliidongia sp.]HEV2676896.1 PLP-dependent aminotransferase family protein [Aliidongia sp.]
MSELYRYEELAGRITALIDAGTLRPGARAPSLREAGRQWRVSLSTALQAYRLLEDRGVLEARPKSGFYVARGGAIGLAAPAISQPPGAATSVSVSAVVQRLLHHASDPNLVPLGCAIPSAELLAAGKLDRCLARAARTKGTRYNIYTEARGDERLRQEIARRALRWGQALAPEDIAVTCGCTEALLLALKAVSRPGDTIAIESPTYFGFLQAIEALDLKALELPTDAASGVDLEALRAALEAGSITACLFSSSVGNPLGGTMPDDRKGAVLDLLARHGVPLIEDDLYGDLSFAEDRPRPFMALRPAADVLYCSSFSKTVSPGYRIGWIVPGRHMAKVLETKFSVTLCGPALLQAALADFLISGGYDSHLRRMRRVFAGNIDQMIRTIEKVFPAGTRVTRPAGGFVLWLELPAGIRSRKLFGQALEQGICFAPGDAFSASDRYGHCLRLSGGYAWSDRIEAGLNALGEMASAALGS